MSSKIVLEYLERQSLQGVAAEEWTLLLNLYSRRLWHQLTLQLETFVNHEMFQDGKGLMELYDCLVKDIADRINPLSLAKIVIKISSFSAAPDAIAFLEPIKLKVASSNVATICITTVFAELYITQQKNDQALELLNKCKAELDNLSGVTTVLAEYYRVSALLHKIKGLFAEFYNDSLHYLGCIELSTLPADKQVACAFDLALSALVGKGIYNFGALLAHNILDSLRGTTQQWLVDLLYAFNSGDIVQYELLRPSWSAWPDLQQNETVMREKISILALMEVVFKRPAHERAIEFSVIATASCVPLEAVELLVMKALSLGLVKGTIDQVDQVAILNWVQPRVLNLDQLATMRQQLGAWSAAVKKVTEQVEQRAPEFFTAA